MLPSQRLAHQLASRALRRAKQQNIGSTLQSKPPPHQQHQQTRSWSLLPDSQERRLNRLMQQANNHLHDPEVQAAYLRALNRVRPAEVIRRVEMGTYATGESVAKEYVRALVATGAIDRAQMSNVLRTVGVATATSAMSGTSSGSGSSSSSSSWGLPPLPPPPGHAAAAAAAATASKINAASQSGPLQVALAEPSTQSQLWRLVRVLGTTFLVLGFLGVIMEERGMMRGMGINLDMNPEPESGDPTTFDDVKGCDEAKAELQEIVEFLRSPERFSRLGGKLPKGVLLLGPPGTGKTLLARAIAGEAQRPFFYASGSEFEEMFVGVGAKRIRELFAAAKQHAPCIVFIDEIDAVGGKRNPKDQRFLTMTLNQFLVELDGFTPSEGIIVVGATNFPESLDQALVRPGRFDRHVIVPPPDVKGRTEILRLHTTKIPLDSDVDLEVIARGTPGFSGADLANLVNMAAIRAAIGDFVSVTMAHLEYAKDKILMGDERKSAVISEETREMTAYHEGGHALCCLYAKDALPVHKATIMPRGQALGMVAQLPDKDMTSMTLSQMRARLVVCMGGRAAEQLIYGDEQVTSGAASDFKQATELAEAMVTQYGMSDKLGLVVYDKERESSTTRAAIENEVKRLLDESYQKAVNILKENERELHRLAKALLQHETLTGDEVKLAVKGKLVGKVTNDKLVDGALSQAGGGGEEEHREGGESGQKKEHGTSPSTHGPATGKNTGKDVLDASTKGAVGEGGRI